MIYGSYGSHLIFNKPGKFDVKIDVIPNGLEKYMVFTINKNLIVIDSMQFMNSSLEKLVKNLLDNDFIYLIQEFGSGKLQLLKQNDVYSYEYMNSFERFSGENLPDKKIFYRSLKDGHITDKEYLTYIKIWNKFSRENMGDYHNHYLKKDVLLLADVFEKFINMYLKFYKLDISVLLD